MFKNTTRTFMCLLAGTGLIITLLTGCKKDEKDTVPITVTDVDGNVYHTVTIGTQTWMVENLKTTRYRNGDPIPHVNNNADWNQIPTPAYCSYNTSGYAADTFGRLYNWYAVAEGAALAPEGWHIPTDADWQLLITYLGGEAGAGGKLKEAGNTHWLTPNTGATNTTGFTALPGGVRSGSGVYQEKGTAGYYWSATEYSANYAGYVVFSNSNADAHNTGTIKMQGFSVRCIKN